MDLKFSKTKRELIKEIETSEDESLLKRYLAEIRAKKGKKVAEVVPMTVDEYRLGVLESLAAVERGEVYSMEEVDKMFGFDEE
jgi:hypothetical protein